MVHLKRAMAEILIPDGRPLPAALARTTHMAIGAHPDDLEVMAIDGILRCFHRQGRWFTGVVVTDGGGAPRGGLYRDTSDAALRRVRAREQKKAAQVGEYAAQVLLDYPSAAVKDGSNPDPLHDLAQLLQAAAPEIVYTHNLADAHDTHVAVALRVVQAIRGLPEMARPARLYGCEVWRDLDWLVERDKVALDCSAHPALQQALLGVFDSQISGGKRYDLATRGRRRANATYHAAHETDVARGLTFAMDLTPLIKDPSRSIPDYVQGFMDRFVRDVRERLRRLAA